MNKAESENNRMKYLFWFPKILEGLYMGTGIQNYRKINKFLKKCV